MSVLGPVLGMITGGLINAGQDDRQIQQQGRLNAQSEAMQDRLNDKAYQRQLAMWKATNLSAQREEAEKAGMSVGLLYGGQGAGGATVGNQSAGSATQAHAGDPNAGAANTIALGMQKAQMELLESQTEKNKAEAQQIAGADTTLKQAQADTLTSQTKLIAEQTKNTSIARQGIELDNIFKNIQNDIQKATSSNQIQQSNYGLKRAELEVDNIIETIQSQKLDNNIKKQATASIIKTYNAQLQNVLTDTILKASNAKLSQTEAAAVSEKLKQGWESLAIQRQEVSQGAVKNTWEHNDRMQNLMTQERNMENMTRTMLIQTGMQVTSDQIKNVTNIMTRFKQQNETDTYTEHFDAEGNQTGSTMTRQNRR